MTEVETRSVADFLDDEFGPTRRKNICFFLAELPAKVLGRNMTAAHSELLEHHHEWKRSEEMHTKFGREPGDDIGYALIRLRTMEQQNLAQATLLRQVSRYVGRLAASVGGIKENFGEFQRTLSRIARTTTANQHVSSSGGRGRTTPVQSPTIRRKGNDSPPARASRGFDNYHVAASSTPTCANGGAMHGGAYPPHDPSWVAEECEAEISPPPTPTPVLNSPDTQTGLALASPTILDTVGDSTLPHNEAVAASLFRLHSEQQGVPARAQGTPMPALLPPPTIGTAVPSQQFNTTVPMTTVPTPLTSLTSANAVSSLPHSGDAPSSGPSYPIHQVTEPAALPPRQLPPLTSTSVGRHPPISPVAFPEAAEAISHGDNTTASSLHQPR